MIRVSHLTKRYGVQLAVDDVSFEVGKGEVLGFLGPNGAGKSTTLRILAGYLAPTSGTVAIDGHDVATDSIGARRCIGYMPEAVPLYPEMRVIEYLRFRAELKRVPRATRTSRIDDAMGQAAVLDVAHKRIEHLSKGYRQRVGLADAIVARPPIVILDEPTAGLDPNQNPRCTPARPRSEPRAHRRALDAHLERGRGLRDPRASHPPRKDRRRGTHGRDPGHAGGQAVDFTLRGDAKTALGVLANVEGVAASAAMGDEDEAGVCRLRATLAAGSASAATVEARGRTVERCIGGARGCRHRRA